MLRRKSSINILPVGIVGCIAANCRLERLLPVIMLFVLLSACAVRSAADYENKLAAWQGQTREALFHKWGYPDRQFAIDRNTYVVTYLRISGKPAGNADEPYRNSLNYGGMPQIRYGKSQIPAVYYCKTNFTITNGIVTDYSFNGDDCV